MNVKPILKLTESQYKRLLERVVKREQGQAPRIAGEAMQEPFSSRLAQGSEGIPVGGMPPDTLNFPKSMPGAGSSQMNMLRGGAADVLGGSTAAANPNRLASPQSRLGPSGGVVLPPRVNVNRGTSDVSKLMRGDPRSSQLMARLKMQKPGVPFSEPTLIEKEYPYEEARRLYQSNPHSMTNIQGFAPGSVPPRVKILKSTPEGAELTEKRYRSVETPFERKARKVADEPTIREKGKAEPSLPEILSTATVLERMWQLMGGKRGMAGKTWDRLRESARGRHRIADTKEYFIRSGLRWREDPEKYVASHPREGKLLMSIWDELSKSAGVE